MIPLPELQSLDWRSNSDLDGKGLGADHIVKDDTAGKVTVTLTEVRSFPTMQTKFFSLELQRQFVQAQTSLAGAIDIKSSWFLTLQYSVNHQPEKKTPNTVHITVPSPSTTFSTRSRQEG